MAPTLGSSLEAQGLADEQRGLLDLIDKLQFAQLDNVKLPQIVVVGDQSAGKSSVLEALSGTPFLEMPEPALALRRRFACEEQKKRISSIPGRFAARDILVVEKTGPEMPMLSLVDLPGLVRVANRDQSEADIQTIEALSDRYMKSSRTIILAVIGGNNDYVQAPILKKARHFDPSGSRTIGVLTKPDMTEGIGLEDKFIELVTNKDRENNFKLGWYILLNPGPGEYWSSAEERSRREADFFTKGKWAALPPHMWGIEALRQKLSSQLQRHVGKHVKSLRRQIQQALEQCETELKAMGSGKDTIEEMRFEMGELFSASGNLVTPAVNGNYKNPVGESFFARRSSPKGTPPQKLRARVREESERFSRLFRQHGSKVNFSSSGSGMNLPAAGVVDDQSKKEFAQREVEPLLRQIRGNELPLDSNPRAPYILFQDFSRNWPILAQEYKENVGVICNEFLADVIDHVWPLRMRDPLRFHFLETKMKEMMDEAEKELKRLTDDLELEIQPYDPEYEQRLIRWRSEATQNGGTYTEAEEVLEKMLIYYDLTARIFTRNTITQVVERHLLLRMLGLFNPIEILRMQNATVEAIAAENKETRDRRTALKARKAAIEEARSICASLAMRSELRAYEDEMEDEVATDDEGHSRNDYSSKRFSVSSTHEAVQQPLTSQNPPVRRKRREERPRPLISVDTTQQRPLVPQQSQEDSQTSGITAAQEWDESYYTTAQSAPHHAPPPPPPRPQKIGFEDSERYDATPRVDRNKESARQKLASVMRLGAQNSQG
ncbi:hypothetical protein TrVFT333_007557 [Trichoderma virens FT-333]|nr:hypothetical protein TrVFT333_007557 [Trichoderma virens FT-333]